MPDGKVFSATTEEAYTLLRLYSVRKEEPTPSAKQIVIRTPQITLERKDVRFIPATDAALDTWKVVINDLFIYRAPDEVYRQAEMLANRISDDEEIVALLML